MMLTGPGILLLAAIVLIVIWGVVLLGSRHFGPQ
jgi:hypothetical protein